jgi:hypothetical protein
VLKPSSWVTKKGVILVIVNHVVIKTSFNRHTEGDQKFSIANYWVLTLLGDQKFFVINCLTIETFFQSTTFLFLIIGIQIFYNL